MTEEDTLPPKKRKAITAILTYPTLQQAAAAIGIGERQLHRWQQEPEFKAALKEAEADLIQAAGIRLTAGLTSALDALAALIDGAQSEAVKRAAANDWMNQQFRNQELRTLAERIDALERTVNQ